MTNDPGGNAAHNPDPEPDGRTQPLSGDVQPGETPPASDQVSAPQGHEEYGPRPWTPWVWIIGIALVVGLVAAMFVGMGVGILN
ncbi:DUF6480 family protein [Antribacter gilvus]|uniref:DUF6480 family protein n=1 Tax=Antribacter gilvus TaxID=2304675 RepID=UPI000F769B4F|nr:DUF6480 family protein [Antribacter gilvus]